MTDLYYYVVFYDSRFIFPYAFNCREEAEDFIDTYHLQAYVTILPKK